jgi:hypothetical protein
MEDFENKYGSPQLKRLNEYFENTPEDVQKQHFHEMMCEMYGIDPDDPKSKRKVKRCIRWSRFRCSVWPHIRNVFIVLCMVWLFVRAGVVFTQGYPLWLPIFYICGGLGWFFIYLRKNFFDKEIY